jgi:hypothetical protein
MPDGARGKCGRKQNYIQNFVAKLERNTRKTYVNKGDSIKIHLKETG